MRLRPSLVPLVAINRRHRMIFRQQACSLAGLRAFGKARPSANHENSWDRGPDSTALCIAARLDVEEDRLALALQHQVKCVARLLAVATLGDQRFAPFRVDQRQHGVVGVEWLALEIEPGPEVLQKTAGEHRDVDVGRLQRVADAGNGTRLDGEKVEAAVLVGAAAAEAVEGRIERLLAAGVVGMVVAAGGIGLPDLDHGVGNGDAGAIDDPAVNSNSLPLRRIGDEHLVAFMVEAEGEERSDGLRRRMPERHVSAPWEWPPARAARCRTGSRAPTPAR